MRQLFIIRHAKSSWKDTSLDDFDRPLNKRGKANIPLMASRLQKRNISPDIVLSSPALRAKTTAKKIVKELGFEKEIIFHEEMYESSVSVIDKILKDLDDKKSVVFVFGHNPELNMLAEYYVGFYENIPTCGILEIEFNSESWRDISAKNATLISFDYPKKENQF